MLSHLQLGKKPIFITGHGRSGTSWIGSTLKQASGVLYYDEPCYPTAEKEGDYSAWFRYVRPDGNDPFFARWLDAAFKGLISHGGGSWLRHRAYRRLLPGYRVIIKEVASFMSLEWIYRRYQPSVLIIIRHPCAVALSEKNLNPTIPLERRIEEILNQPALAEDHLLPYIAVLEKARTPFEIYGALWAARNRVIANLIPHYPQWKLLSYEEVSQDPVGSFRGVFGDLNLNWGKKVKNSIIRTTTEERPGNYSINRITIKQVNKWKREMNQSEVEQVRRCVEPFNLPFYNSESDWDLH